MSDLVLVDPCVFVRDHDTLHLSHFERIPRVVGYLMDRMVYNTVGGQVVQGLTLW